MHVGPEFFVISIIGGLQGIDVISRFERGFSRLSLQQSGNKICKEVPHWLWHVRGKRQDIIRNDGGDLPDDNHLFDQVWELILKRGKFAGVDIRRAEVTDATGI